MLKFRRKHFIQEFSTPTILKTVILLTMVFLLGLAISVKRGISGVVAYLLLWGFSYPVLYLGACRHCVYYGKRCPVPLEGSCVHHVVAKGTGNFGYTALFWASMAYLLRFMLPARIIVTERLVTQGAAYFGIVSAFWVNHLLVEACPNCINTACPLNPDH